MLSQLRLDVGYSTKWLRFQSVTKVEMSNFASAFDISTVQVLCTLPDVSDR